MSNNNYEEFRKQCDETIDKVVEKLKNFETFISQNDTEFTQCIQSDIRQFHQAGILTPSFGKYGENKPQNETKATTVRGRPKKRTDHSSRAPSNSDSSKENESEINKDTIVGRPRRNAFKKASEVFTNQQVNQPLNTKLNQPSANEQENRDLVVKIERLTDDFIRKSSGLSSTNSNNDLQLKKEAIEMPPPSKPPVRQNQRGRGKPSKNVNVGSVQIKSEPSDEDKKKAATESKTRSSAKNSKLSENARDSDVEIQTDDVDMIVINESIVEIEKPSRTRGRTKNKRKLENKQQDSIDTESEGENKKQRRDEPVAAEQTIRVTRTRAAAKIKEAEKQMQSDSSTSVEDEKTRADKSPTKAPRAKNRKAAKNNNISEYEDAVSDIEKIIQTAATNNTATKSRPIMNETIVVGKPAILNETVVIQKSNNVMNETRTVDVAPAVSKESKNLLNETRTLVIASTVDHKVVEDALLTDDEDVVKNSPVTQTTKKTKPVFSPYEEKPVKKRVQAFEKLYSDNNTPVPSKIPCVSNKIVTKKANEKMAESGVTNTKVHNSYITPQKNKLPGMLSSSIANSSFLSELKGSTSESRSRQLRLKHKDNEIMRKQEAYMQSLTEERKRKREQRQIKAQQAREAMEREKQQVLDSVMKAKEEKLKKQLSEKEALLQKQREESAIKRAQAMKKAKEEKRREELKGHDKQPEENIPPYLKYETPFLPTADCYDSDDEKAPKTRSTPPWANKQALLPILEQMTIAYSMRNILFSNCQTPDLKEIFPTIESHKLKRTSSAIWDRSQMSRLDVLTEED